MLNLDAHNLLAYVYVGSTPLFVALYRAFGLLGHFRRQGAFSQVTVDALLVDGKTFAEFLGPKVVHPDWRLAADGRTAYLQLLNDLRMFAVDLSGPAGQPVTARVLGERIAGKHPDSRGSIRLGLLFRMFIRFSFMAEIRHSLDQALDSGADT